MDRTLYTPSPWSVKFHETTADEVLGGGSAGPDKSGAKRIFRRADVLKLMEEQPDRYEALSGEIEKAYREGRVR